MISDVRSTPLSSLAILRLVVGVVLATLMGWYAMALSSFLFDPHGFSNRFADVALEHHLTHLIWSNLVVLKGYFLVAVAFVLLTYPAVRLWAMWRPFGRWGVVWRALVVTGVFYGFFTLRLLLEKPYFGDYGYLMGWYEALGTLFGSGVQTAVRLVVAQLLPGLIVLVAVGFYLVQLRRLFNRQARPVLFTLLVICGAVVAVTMTGYGSSGLKHGVAVTELGNRPKNILILASDSLRSDHLGCSGYARDTSPSIDALAAAGIQFERCLTPIASTLESMTSIFSSQYPHTHGVFHMFPDREMVERGNEAPSMVKILREHGYDSSVIGDWCACGFKELPMGFEDVIVSDFDNFRVYMTEAVFLRHQILPLFFDNPTGYSIFPMLRSFASYMTPDVVTDQIAERLKARADDGRPFVMLGFYSCTHLPYKTPSSYAKLWTDPAYDGPHKHELQLNVDEFIGKTDINEKWSRLPPGEVEQVKGLYDGCVRMFDDCVGRVVEVLKQEGLMEDTIILITSDHGDDLFEPNVTFGHGLTFNGGDQSNHIPAVFHVPGIPEPGRKVKEVIRSLDFAPTLLELAGMPVDPQFEGVSLAPVVRGREPMPDIAYYGETSYLFYQRTIPGEKTLHIPPMDETTYIDPDFDYHFVLKPKYRQAVLDTKEHALRTNRFKFVQTPGVIRPIERLFDLKDDPHCERDVKAAFPGVATRMREALESWVKDHQERRISEIFPDGNEWEVEAKK